MALANSWFYPEDICDKRKLHNIGIPELPPVLNVVENMLHGSFDKIRSLVV